MISTASLRNPRAAAVRLVRDSTLRVIARLITGDSEVTEYERVLRSSGSSTGASLVALSVRPLQILVVVVVSRYAGGTRKLDAYGTRTGYCGKVSHFVSQSQSLFARYQPGNLKSLRFFVEGSRTSCDRWVVGSARGGGSWSSASLRLRH